MIEAAEHNEFRTACKFFCLCEKLQAVHLRHSDVDDRDIRADAFNQNLRADTIVCFSDELDPVILPWDQTF